MADSLPAAAALNGVTSLPWQTILRLWALPTNLTLAILLAVACFIIARDYRFSGPRNSAFFKLVCLSWVLNALHVGLSTLAEYAGLSGMPGRHDALMLAGFIVGTLSTLIVLVAVSLYQRQPHYRLQAILIGVIGACLILYRLLIGSSNDAAAQILDGTLTAVGLVAILVLATTLQSIASESPPTWQRTAIVLPLFAYAALQVLYPFGEHLSWGHPLGFALGAVLKGIHLVGLGAFEREESLSDRAISTRDPEILRLRNTLSQSVHEIKVSILQLEFNIPELTESVRTRGRITDYATVVGEAGQRALAVLEGTHMLLSGEVLTNKEEDWESFKVTTVLQAAIIAVRSTARAFFGDREVTFTCHFSGSMYVRCRRYALTRAFINVLRNTYDAFGPAGGEVLVAARWLRDAPGHQKDQPRIALIEITDHGRGVAGENLPRLFEHGFTTHDGEHRGHGLKVVQEIIRQHGGTVQVESPLSTKQQGTRVTITIPSRRGSRWLKR